MRQEGLTKSANQMEQRIAGQDAQIRAFKDDAQQMLFKNSLTYKELKQGVVRLYRQWVLGERINDSHSTDLYAIYAQERVQIRRGRVPAREG